MRFTLLRRLALSAVFAVGSQQCLGADVYGLKPGTPDIKSAGPLTFTPDGILFVGDTKAAVIFAIDPEDRSGNPKAIKLDIANFEKRLAEKLGLAPEQMQINDLAVNPVSGNTYLSLTLGTGADAKPGLVRIDNQGDINSVSLDKISFSKVQLPNVPDEPSGDQGRQRRPTRQDSITDLAYVDGQVIVSGLSSSDSPSNVRSIEFPFTEASEGSSLEIFHAAHGRSEDNAAIRTFVPFMINGEPNLLAGFVCTPLVRFPLSKVADGEKIVGTTIAELGNRNRPLDMIAYKKDGKDFLLLANSARGVMKVSTENIDREEGLTEPVKGGGTAGQAYEPIDALSGTIQLDRLNDTTAVVIIQSEEKGMTLKTVALP